MAKSIRTILSIDLPHIHVVGSKPLTERLLARSWMASSSFFLGTVGIMGLIPSVLATREAILYVQDSAAYSPIQALVSLVAVGALSNSLRPLFQQLRKAHLSPWEIDKKQALLEACDKGDLNALKQAKVSSWDWVGYPNGLQELKSNVQPSSPILMALNNRHMHILAWMAEQGTDVLALTEQHYQQLNAHKGGAPYSLKGYVLTEMMEDGKEDWAKNILKSPSLNAQERLAWLQKREEEKTWAIQVHFQDAKQEDLDDIRRIFQACYPSHIQIQDLETYTEQHSHKASFLNQLCQEALIEHQKTLLHAHLPQATKSPSSKSRI